MKMALQKTSLADRVIALIESARQKTVTAINVAMVYTYYEIGRQIVEEEQGGRKRAGYGDRVIAELSRRLTARYGRGWSPRTLASMKSFYLIYSERVILQTPSAKSSRRVNFANSVCKIRPFLRKCG